MEQMILLNSTEFYQKQKDLIKSILDESLQSLNTLKQEEVLSMSDVCALLQKSRQTVISWSDRGILKRRYIGDSSVFYLRSEIMAAMSTKKNNEEK
ncbi:helix-turn-helix transcriptional regulator [Labilibacter marinus]|uniref:helix-turn-helix transcriptional regulator n=1 Tax=Labilibacter marinus TaxID=1477105 RepID=UPI00094F717E|nr:DNA-binding protein [Labilibacter marinus]